MLPQNYGQYLYETEEEKRQRLLREQAMQQSMPQQGPVSPDMFARMLQVESGNRDFTAQGTPMTSPKGAMYAAQVMPATAQQPGYGVTPARSQTPEEYNRVGREYYEAMKNKFGSAEKAAAAYNAGPGRVQQALQRSQQTGQPYTQYLPQETQNYLQKVSMQPQTQQTQQTTQQMPQLPDSSMFIKRYQDVQNDPKKLLELSNDPNAPEYLRNRSVSRSAELLTANREEQKFKENLPNMTENDLAKMLRSKTTDGSWGKYFLANMLGMESVRDAEAAKLGIGTERTVMLPDGQAGMIKVSRNGTPIEGYFADGRRMDAKELITAASQGTGSGLDVVGGTYVNDSTGEVGRVVTNKATGQSYIQTDKGRKGLQGFRPQSSQGSLSDQRARLLQDINLKLQGKTEEEKMAILRNYNQQLVASGYPAVSPNEVNITAPQVQGQAPAQAMPATAQTQAQAAPMAPVAPTAMPQAQPQVTTPRPTGPQLEAQATKLKETAQEVGKDIGVTQTNMGRAEQNADYLITKIDEIITHPGFKFSVGVADIGERKLGVGIPVPFGATVSGMIPGSDVSDFRARFDEIQGQSFLQAIDSLRGMGALSNLEGQTATKAIQRMATSQSEKEFKAAAKDFQDIIKRGIDRSRTKLGREEKYGTKPASEEKKIKKLTREEQKAVDWLRENPNDPRAPEVRQRLGL